jgi:hypothetical protein
MLKVRLQGTKNDIRWFIRLMERDSRVRLENTSTFFSNKGTEKYKRLYTEIHRVDKEKKYEQNKAPAKDLNDYSGAGRTFY